MNIHIGCVWTKTIASAVSIVAVFVSVAGCGGISGAPGSMSQRATLPPDLRSRERLLHSFDYTDGAYNTYGGLVSDAAGNLYGTTQFGGLSGCNILESCGVVFELVRLASGGWKENVLHDFSPDDPLGFFPRAAVIVDAKGNLYGTTDSGGRFCLGSVSCGTVYELSPSSGSWTAKVLYAFSGSNNGSNPQAALTFDARGNLYGTTSEGGGRDDGTIFELMPRSSGYWIKTILHSFANREGRSPSSKLTFDKAGDLYGTTIFAGAYRSACGGYGCGTACELKPGAKGSWTLKVLHSFGNGNDGAYPVSALTIDSHADLFGVTAEGGTHASDCLGYGCGTAYELTRKNDKWAEQIIHNFGSGTDGTLPRGDLILDGSGALYGTAASGGAYAGGIAFRLVLGTSSKWDEQVLHSFGNGEDGSLPYSGMIFDAAHDLYGTTDIGGHDHAGMCRKSRGCGTIFEITP
ncbi:MAG TPA: choice-of-anchor tandem repeat GloVer-containing protein [Candidatus Cybelea sp.]|nr:choice-of-anchor tandem repeat GloVer-containing protein [Candidatus Cybelea sp.]